MTVPRIYDPLLAEHLASNRQMAFFSGPRQVGKTTTCRLRADACVNRDDKEPKWYLRDWALIGDTERRAETFVVPG